MTSPWTIAAALAAAAVCAAQPAAAEESGDFAALGSFVHDYTELEHGDGAFFGGVAEGTNTVTESSGAPFAPGDHSHAVCVVFGKRSAAGLDLSAPCTQTDADGDSYYTLSKRIAGDVDAGGGGEGAMTMVGGTGKYAGLSGSCAYDVDYLAGDRLVFTMHCAWRRDGD